MPEAEEAQSSSDESESSLQPEEGFIAHQLSPSSWNRYEECPSEYWLSLQGLPR